MKKFTKMLALGLAAALVFGMSVSAAKSVDTSSYKGGTIEGNRTDVTSSVLTPDAKTAMVAAIASIDDAVNAKEDKVVVAGAFDLKIVEDSAKGQDVTVAIPGVVSNHEYKLFHFTDDFSSYEIIDIKSVEGGKITFTLGDSASPFVLVDMGEKAAAPAPSNTPANNNNNTSSSPATAPKTGEAAPVAGIMALILMAGAVICAKKVRYNR